MAWGLERISLVLSRLPAPHTRTLAFKAKPASLSSQGSVHGKTLGSPSKTWSIFYCRLNLESHTMFFFHRGGPRARRSQEKMCPHKKMGVVFGKVSTKNPVIHRISTGSLQSTRQAPTGAGFNPVNMQQLLPVGGAFNAGTRFNITMAC